MNRPILDGLPLRVRAGLATTWAQAVALDYSIHAQPKDNLNEALWKVDLIAEDLADLGFEALISLPEETQALLIHEAADAALLCEQCLAQLLLGEEPAEAEK